MPVLGQSNSISNTVQASMSYSSRQELPNDGVRTGEAAPQNASAGCGFAPQRVPESEVFVFNIPAQIFLL